MQLLKKLAGETVIYGLGNLSGRVLNFIVLTPYLSHQFATGEYGIHATLYAYAAFLIILFTYRMETAFFRFASLDKQKPHIQPRIQPQIQPQIKPQIQPQIQRREKSEVDIEVKKSIFSTATISLLISTLIFVGLMVVFSQPIANFIQYPDQRLYVIWFALIIGFDALSAIPLAKLRMDSRPIYFVITKLAGVVVNVIFIIFFLEICPKLAENGNTLAQTIYQEENKVGLVFVANLMGSLTTLLLLLPLYFSVKLRFDIEAWKKMLRYSAPLIIVGLAGITNEVADRIFLQRLLPGTVEYVQSQIGIYGACYKFAILMALFTQAFNYAAEPFFFRNANREDSKQVYGQVAEAFTLVGCFAFLSIWFYIDLVQFMVDEPYRVGIRIVPILLLANVCLGLYYNFAIWYKLSDKTHIGAYIACTGAIVTIAINVALIPQMGYMASAWATLAAYATMSALCYLTGQRYYKIDYPIRKMLIYLGLAVGLFFISQWVRGIYGAGSAMLLTVNTLLLMGFMAGAVWSLRTSYRLL